MTASADAVSLQQAADWMLRLRSGEADAAEERRYHEWRAADPSHEAACTQLERSLGAFAELRARGISSQLAGRTLAASRHRTRRRAALAVVGLGVGGLALGWRGAEEAGLMADARTASGERRQLTLPGGDGSLWLDAKTALDTSIGGDRRHWRLHRGRMLADLVASSGVSWSIGCALGTLACSGGRFMMTLRDEAAGVLVEALSGPLRLKPGAGAPIDIAPGERVTLSPGNRVMRAAADTRVLWTQGRMALDDQPLGDLIEALQPYRRGVLRIDPQAARLRISGVFSLDDTDLTLSVLAATHPVKITKVTPYWVAVSLS